MSFEATLRIHQRINSLARSLVGRPAFDEMHVLIPNPASPEPGFIRAVSWLYCLYFEAGRVSLGFLRRLGQVYSLVDYDTFQTHTETVRCLRTELHHNLGFEDGDLYARKQAEEWRRTACGTALPRTADQWAGCYRRIVDQANSFLDGLEAVVARLEALPAEEAEKIVADWLRLLERHIPAAEFDPLIDDAKHRLGLDSLDTVGFRNRHVARWRKSLEQLEKVFDFEREATRLIEKALLEDDGVVLPITGRDVMQALGVGPGPEIARLLEMARRHFEVERCGREELLEHLLTVTGH